MDGMVPVTVNIVEGSVCDHFAMEGK